MPRLYVLTMRQFEKRPTFHLFLNNEKNHVYLFPIPEKMKYAEVILPLPLASTYVYSIPDEMEPLVRVHVRVTAPFGNKRSYTAIVKEIHEHPPDTSLAYKEIAAVLDESPVIDSRQMQFWDWIASYYLCKTGDVYKAAVPPGLVNNKTKKRVTKREIPESHEKANSRNQQLAGACTALNALTEAQQTALAGVQAVFGTKPVCLLHGVSSCGKTEIYIHLILNTLQQGSHVLYLLPEIAVTKRITERLGRIFGESLMVYHSGFSDSKRVEIWNRLLHAKAPMVVVGVRSSVFLPFANLGLVIVDEEHDDSYRQHDPAPRYHARNAAIMLAQMYGAKTLLGSATPSLESFYNAKSGKYGLVKLPVRYEQTSESLVRLVDVKELRRKKIMKATLFSPLLKTQMEEALKRNEQVVLFQSRRGFALVMECKSCGHVARCVDCEVTLTYHKHVNRLVCHYCGYSVLPLAYCPVCRGTDIKLMGFGTETVEEEIEALFPGIPASRLDLDTARTRKSYERILTDFEQGKTKILIGARMLAKGLDCKQVSVVGIVNADSLMNAPDFRAHERAFQLMMQVISCGGRSGKQGVVVLQTSHPEHPLIQAVQAFDYERMAFEQLSERKMFRYPPYFRLIVLELRYRDESILEELSVHYAETLQQELGERVLPPFAPPVNRVQMLYVRHIMLKLETAFPVVQVRTILEQTNRTMQSLPKFRQVILHYEVDN